MQALRYWLKSKFAWLRVRIGEGPLAGRWIGVMCGMRFIRGRYDRSAVTQLLSLVEPETIVYDVGAHVGYLTMVAAQKVGPRGRVVAFEPLPLNLAYLRGHLKANRMDNVEVVDACISEHGGQVHFDLGKGTGRGRLVTQTGGGMRAISIDEEVQAGRLPVPHFIKMDVEGAELMALRGAAQTLRQHHPTLLLSVHSPQLRTDCSALLQELGYELAPSAKRNELLAQAPR